VEEAQRKRIKITSDGDWWNSSATVDGEHLLVQSVDLHVGVEDPTTLRLVVLEGDVRVDQDFVSAEDYRKLVEENASLRVALQLERAVVQNIHRIPLKVTVT
jgi:hypothetical protein